MIYDIATLRKKTVPIAKKYGVEIKKDEILLYEE